jgi:hypothetical protein
MTKIPLDYIEKVYAGWLGKLIGIRHGAPIEMWEFKKIRKPVEELVTYK